MKELKEIICELGAFSVIGQEVELTNLQKRNIQITTQFWREFNENLKKAYLSQMGNWTKYAFTQRRAGKLFYFCAIPKNSVLPKGFIAREIKPSKYLVVEHHGSMDNIYRTYEHIYKEILPKGEYRPIRSNFLHFEKYDRRFHWNKESSVIEIWVAIEH